MKFVDIVDIYVRSGDGGNGHISFRKEKYVPKGGPSGGDGGNGGNVVLIANRQLTTLLDFRYNKKYEAESGNEGGKSGKTGKSGKNIYIKVPVGTLVKNKDTDEAIVDLTEDGQEFVLARGGSGGWGNARFATSTNQTPRFANPGLPGEEFNITLELKLLADVGIVGFPNVGKSTLISVISAAKPKIADYPFTTLVPNLGMVRIAEGKSYTVADIPGLIEGASEGKGLGFQFLRHIERTSALLFMLDSLSHDPKSDYKILKKELKSFSNKLDKKKKIVCFSRIDAITPEQMDEIKKIKFREKDLSVFYISSVSGESIESLKFALWEMISKDEE